MGTYAFYLLLSLKQYNKIAIYSMIDLWSVL